MEKILVVYYSTTGNTQSMADYICEGIREAGAEVECVDASSYPAVDGYTKIAFGCPAMGAETLEESVFEPYFESVEDLLGGKNVALFGSYGWGDGQWMRDWQDRVTGKGATLFEEGLIVNGAPEGDECKEFGSRFAAL